jgi:hypothetical protein
MSPEVALALPSVSGSGQLRGNDENVWPAMVFFAQNITINPKSKPKRR